MKKKYYSQQHLRSLLLYSLMASFLWLTACENNQLNEPLPDNFKAEQSTLALSNGIEAVQQEFVNKQYESKLYRNFNDTVQLHWEPNWNIASQQKIKDTITYTYIPLQPKLRATRTNKIAGSFIDNDGKEYIIAKSYGTATEFYRATYIFDKPPTEKNNTATEPSYAVNFKSFTGKLLLKNLRDNNTIKFTYKNGKRQAEGNDLNKKNKPGDVTASGYVTTCVLEYECYFSTSCDNPGGGIYVKGTITRGTNYCPWPSNSGIYNCTGWQQTDRVITQVCTTTYVPDDPTNPTDPYVPPGDGGTSGPPPVEVAFNPANIYLFSGQKPLAEYSNNCSGAQGMWNMSIANPSNLREVVGVLTTDGKLMIVAQTGYSGGAWGGLYQYQGKAYYTYPVNAGAPTQSYEGIISAAGHYIIPIKATIHTHVPCVNDGTNGISGMNLSQGDKDMATTFPMIPHYIIGCNALGMFRQGYASPTLIQSGSLSITCTNIK